MATTQNTFATISSPQKEDDRILRHPLEGPTPTLQQRFYPFGYPVDVSTNSKTVLEIMEGMWEKFTTRFQKDPIRCQVTVVESNETRCPPEPKHHLELPLLTSICDGDNFSIVDLDRSTVHTHITEAALRHPLFLSHFLLSACYSCICTRYATPIHAACVSWNSRGILLCGESGAGKSTLAYACARRGWTYTSDDATYLENQGTGRHMIGNSHQVRLRPESATLFPEIGSLKMAARAAGKPSVEVPTDGLQNVQTSPTANVDYVVYLNRKHHGPPVLVPYPKHKAQQSMRETLYGVPRTLKTQYRAIDRLLTAPIFELRYNTLNEAIPLLQSLAEEVVDAGLIASACR